MYYSLSCSDLLKALIILSDKTVRMSAVKLEDFTNHRKKNNKVEALSRRPIPNIPK